MCDGKEKVCPNYKDEAHLTRLAEDIRYREELLAKLCQDHWLYAMSKDILESKKREYSFLSSQEKGFQ